MSALWYNGMGPYMNGFWEKASKISLLLRRWGTVLLGRSYWHVPQGLGRSFVPGRLCGYYIDLTAKTRWNGLVDEAGLPVNEFRGKQVYFPTTLLQKALGHWDLWLTSGQEDEVHRSAFLNIARWAVETQDEQGGWPVWPLVGLRYASPYSAMTQGEGISVLVRAYQLEQDPVYLDAARRALGPMHKPLKDGGTGRVVPEGLILEEVPIEKYKAILNGWVFALFGLYDYLLTEDSSEARQMLERSLSALVAHLPSYNAKYWSYYDLSGHLASPFYHRLHIAQLEALSLVFPEYAQVFNRLREQFMRQEMNVFCRTGAVMVKAYQKLRNPPEVILK